MGADQHKNPSRIESRWKGLLFQMPDRGRVQFANRGIAITFLGFCRSRLPVCLRVL